MILHKTVKVLMFIHYTQYFQLDECDDAEQCEEDVDSSLEQLEDIGSPSVQFNVLGQQDSEIQKKKIRKSCRCSHFQKFTSKSTILQPVNGADFKDFM